MSAKHSTQLLSNIIERLNLVRGPDKKQVSLPEWRWILNKSIEGQDKKREEYARWMLKEILDDLEYEEKAND